MHDSCLRSTSDPISAMTFGKLGREDCALVLVTVGGGLSVKILKRTAAFQRMDAAALGLVGAGAAAGGAAAAKVRKGPLQVCSTIYPSRD